MPEDEAIERESRIKELEANPGRGFLSWLNRNSDRADRAELAELNAVLRKLPEKYGASYLAFDFEKYSAALEEEGLTELIEPMLIAATEWRADAAAAKAGSVALLGSEAVRASKKSMVAEMPVPVVECGFRGCKDAAMPGATRCRRHGGDWLDPRIRQNLLMAAYMKLVESTDIAVEALIQVAEHGRREEARVMAAKEILDRAGIRAGVDITIHAAEETGRSTHLDEIREKLDRMADSLAAREKLVEIVDAEIVEDNDDGR